jgi:membrane-anchored protein YejM (alkaline phosphatase superfamily)
LNYPRAPLVFGEGGRRPNVVVIIVESLRFDMLHPDIMPNLWKWGQENIVAERHFTSGNRSTHGVFGVMYGLNATYWNRVLAERAGPVMVRELKKQGYTFKIVSSTETIFIEAPKTSFVEIREVVEDHWTGELPADQRDVIVTDKFLTFVKENRQPFFSFVWYDGPHQPYRYPAEQEVFPVELRAEDVNYIKLASDRRHGTELFNRYKNSVHYADAQAYRIISAIRDAGMLDNTLIFVVGDHGEEFGEDGYFGHGSQFNIWQTSTPMAAHIPGAGARKVTRLTSHIDIVPTVLDYMGVTNAPSDYSHGVPLLAEEGPPFVLIGGWDNCAIVDKESVTVFGLEAYNADITVMDYDCQALPNQDAAITERQGYLGKVLEMFRQFTK